MQNTPSDFFFHKPVYVGISNVDSPGNTAQPNSEKNRKRRNPAAQPTDFDLQFFPESGILLTGQLQNIAFKAIASDGLSVEVSGRLFTDQQEELFAFESNGNGMGSLVMQPQAGTGYYALVRTASGQERRFDLPQQQAEGVALHLGCYGGNILYEVINQTERPNHALYLLVHARGKVYVLSPLSRLNGKIPESALPAGINTFSVVDSVGNTFCERLLFDWSLNVPTVAMQSNQASYGRREPVELQLNLHSVTGKSPAGNFAVSITDSRVVIQDTVADNILSYLLLSSDIKGYIEQPALYFSGDPARERARMDLLMLTQGWRRFNTSEIVKGNHPRQQYYLEMGQALSGSVSSVTGKPIRNCDVVMLSSYQNQTRIVQTDTLGRYLFDGMDIPDSTSIILKAFKKKTILDVEVIPEEEIFVKYRGNLPFPAPNRSAIPASYLQQTREQFSYEGDWHVTLGEISVEAKKIETNPGNQFFAGFGDDLVSRAELEKFTGISLQTALNMLPGVQVMAGEVSIRGGGPPLFIVDNFMTDRFEEISYLSTFDIERIELFKGASASIFGSRGANGAIAITLRSGVGFNRQERIPLSLAKILPLGYQLPSQFYTPKYEVDSIRRSPVPDLRTTIYWNPELRTDSTGILKVKFHTADPANNYQIVLEGITDEGEICRYVGSLNRREK
jgi:TonB-dependent SusC/RagA subfamily outer membrane receptor